MITKETTVRPTGKLPRKSDNRIGQRVSAYNQRYLEGITISGIISAITEVGLGDIKYDIARGYLEVIA
tara:strand:- start:215 stop:418 length:204 start_codon:yes stop_codon:yes gene_type:complete